MMNIIHIDDSSFQRRISKKFIDEAFPYAECRSLSDGEMLDYIDDNDDFADVDMVITDLLMGKISGHDVIKYVREISDDCFIAVLSSNIQKAEKEKCYQNGADFFIEKPLTTDKLTDLKVFYDSRK